ncbi:hypothetical protein BVC80_9095g143 [Macleaya cordata]|uniref:Uncharacterized protein n=1 Tax=Macleaya cordata TaxID=56857 RepID=A0A200PXK6_MACCD|nr:hypothetical protein BVC80_9095g143 [Macleaya cordata]
MEEEEIWKCRKHPSKNRSTGICPTCLRDRLISLCPDCANLRPCPCCPSSSSSSSSSSSFSSDFQRSAIGVGVVGRMSNLIENEPAFQRSRSAAFPFLRSRLSDKDSEIGLPPSGKGSKSSFWSVFKMHNKSKKVEEPNKEDEMKKMMIRSQSVGISCYSDRDQTPASDVRLKGRSWYFPSPIKVFRQPKSAKINQERSPLCRG